MPVGATLDALLAAGDSAGPTLRFPVIKIQSGAKVKAAFMAPDFNEAEFLPELPEGTKPVEAVFIAHRLRVTAWPSGYDENATEPSKPVFTCYIPAGDTPGTVQAIKAGERYNYTKREAKVKFDTANGGPGPGHIRAALEVLVWYPGLGGLMEVRCPEGHGATRASAKALRSLCDPQTGGMGCQPVALIPVTESEKTWNVQSLGMAVLTGPTGKTLWDSFHEWKTLAAEDAETVADVGAWIAGTDAPLTDDIRVKLAQAAAM